MSQCQKKKRLHAGTSLDGGALHFFTSTALGPSRTHIQWFWPSAVFTEEVILSPSPLRWQLPRWPNMSNQVQPSQKLGEQKGGQRVGAFLTVKSTYYVLLRHWEPLEGIRALSIIVMGGEIY